VNRPKDRIALIRPPHLCSAFVIHENFATIISEVLTYAIQSKSFIGFPIDQRLIAVWVNRQFTHKACFNEFAELLRVPLGSVRRPLAETKVVCERMEEVPLGTKDARAESEVEAR